MKDLEAEKNAEIAFRMMDQIEVKERELSTILPEHEFIYRIDYLATLLEGTVGEIESLMRFDVLFPKIDAVRPRIPKLQRNVFLFFILAQVIAEQFEKDQSLLNNLRNRDEIKSLLSDWRNVPAIAVTCACRNILAHVRPFMGENLNIHRMVEKSGDHKVWVDYSLSRRDWAGIGRLVRKIRDTKVKTAAEDYLKSLQVVNTNPGSEKLEPTYSLLPLIESTVTETRRFFDSLRVSFGKAYSAELAKRSALVGELLALNIELDKIAPPMQE